MVEAYKKEIHESKEQSQAGEFQAKSFTSLLQETSLIQETQLRSAASTIISNILKKFKFEKMKEYSITKSTISKFPSNESGVAVETIGTNSQSISSALHYFEKGLNNSPPNPPHQNKIDKKEFEEGLHYLNLRHSVSAGYPSEEVPTFKRLATDVEKSSENKKNQVKTTGKKSTNKLEILSPYHSRLSKNSPLKEGFSPSPEIWEIKQKLVALEAVSNLSLFENESMNPKNVEFWHDLESPDRFYDLLTPVETEPTSLLMSTVEIMNNNLASAGGAQYPKNADSISPKGKRPAIPEGLLNLRQPYNSNCSSLAESTLLEDPEKIKEYIEQEKKRLSELKTELETHLQKANSNSVSKSSPRDQNSISNIKLVKEESVVNEKEKPQKEEEATPKTIVMAEESKPAEDAAKVETPIEEEKPAELEKVEVKKLEKVEVKKPEKPAESKKVDEKKKEEENKTEEIKKPKNIKKPKTSQRKDRKTALVQDPFRANRKTIGPKNLPVKDKNTDLRIGKKSSISLTKRKSKTSVLDKKVKLKNSLLSQDKKQKNWKKLDLGSVKKEAQKPIKTDPESKKDSKKNFFKSRNSRGSLNSVKRLGESTKQNKNLKSLHGSIVEHFSEKSAIQKPLNSPPRKPVYELDKLTFHKSKHTTSDSNERTYRSIDSKLRISTSAQTWFKPLINQTQSNLSGSREQSRVTFNSQIHSHRGWTRLVGNNNPPPPPTTVLDKNRSLPISMVDKKKVNPNPGYLEKSKFTSPTKYWGRQVPPPAKKQLPNKKNMTKNQGNVFAVNKARPVTSDGKNFGAKIQKKLNFFKNSVQKFPPQNTTRSHTGLLTQPKNTKMMPGGPRGKVGLKFQQKKQQVKQKPSFASNLNFAAKKPMNWRSNPNLVKMSRSQDFYQQQASKQKMQQSYHIASNSRGHRNAFPQKQQYGAFQKRGYKY